MKKLISIVIPAYNEEAVVSELIRRLANVANRLTSYNFEFIIVENGSTDKTLDKLLVARRKDARVKILHLAKNATCDGGIVAGLTYATGAAAIVMMADLQDTPELIPQFIQKWESGYHIVYGIVKKRKKQPFTRKIGTFFYKLMHFITQGQLPENVSDFRLMDRRVYTLITKLPEHNKFFRGLVVWTGFKETGIYFDRPERFAGKSKADFLTVLHVAINGIIAFTSIPLRMFWIFIFILYIGTIVSLVQSVSSFSLTLGILSIMATMIGIQGEYILRIFEEVRNRPNHIVQDLYGLESKKIE